eukprot:1081011-Prymnesium_polylepis.1
MWVGVPSCKIRITLVDADGRERASVHADAVLSSLPHDITIMHEGFGHWRGRGESKLSGDYTRLFGFLSEARCSFVSCAQFLRVRDHRCPICAYRTAMFHITVLD